MTIKGNKSLNISLHKGIGRQSKKEIEAEGEEEQRVTGRKKAAVKQQDEREIVREDREDRQTERDADI